MGKQRTIFSIPILSTSGHASPMLFLSFRSRNDIVCLSSLYLLFLVLGYFYFPHPLTFPSSQFTVHSAC
ncbi:hypothetical protein RIF29_22625 [Crotalaria pallida]|uniref:Uncharacterized protein n=1 Tax=Crotalaria pallida TaxID=3830 RepID=A0AAN9F7A2_CROPI